MNIYSEVSQEMIYIGTSGFSYDDWREVFYPSRLAKRDFLTFYSGNFPALELNSSYYAIPSPALIRSLIERTPYEFAQLFPLCLTARVVGTEPIATLEVICNGTVIYEHLHTVGQEVRFAIPVDLPYVRAERVLEGVPRVVEVRHHPGRFDQYYYLRVRQVDGHVAWSSPIFVRMRKEEV